MRYRIAGIDVHKKMLAVVVTDVAGAGAYQFVHRRVATSPSDAADDTRWLRRQGDTVSRKRVRRLMRLLGLQAIFQRPSTSQPHPEHRIYPYLLRDLPITRPNHV